MIVVPVAMIGARRATAPAEWTETSDASFLSRRLGGKVARVTESVMLFLPWHTGRVKKSLSCLTKHTSGSHPNWAALSAVDIVPQKEPKPLFPMGVSADGSFY